MADAERMAARTSGKRVGHWVAEAIREKIEREKEAEDVA